MWAQPLFAWLKSCSETCVQMYPTCSCLGSYLAKTTSGKCRILTFPIAISKTIIQSTEEKYTVKS